MTGPGRKRRGQAQALAKAAADVHANGYVSDARTAFLAHLRRHRRTGATWEEAAGHLSRPDFVSPNVAGAIITRLKEAGLIACCGMRPSRRPAARGRNLLVWRLA